MFDLKSMLNRYVDEQTPTTPPPFDDTEVSASRRSPRRVATIVAVPVVLAATIVGVQLVRDQGASEQPGKAPIAAGPSHGPSQAPIVAGGSSASCVEPYALATLKHRAFAFDGTVTGTAAMEAPADGSGALAGYSTVTFKVNEWFRGGDRPTVAVDMMSGPESGTVSSVKAASYGVGTRLLVSGEPRFGGAPMNAPMAWGCGFTRPFDKSTAVAWR